MIKICSIQKSKVIFLRILALFSLISLWSCIADDPPGLNSFLVQLENGVDPAKVEAFRTLEIDSAGYVLGMVCPEVEEAFLELSPDSELDHYFDTLAGWDLDLRVTYLAIAFHKFLNDSSLALDRIMVDIRKYTGYTAHLQNLDRQDEYLRIQTMNDSACKLGDTIEVFLLMDSKSEMPMAFYQGGPYPYYGKERDSIGVTGVLIAKDFESMDSTRIDTTRRVFRLEIISKTRDDVLLNWHYLDPGDTFTLYLFSYGRIIKQ